MRFIASVSAALAFAASAIAQTPDFNPIFTPKEGAELEAGSTFEITWEAPAKYQDGTVSISLIGGADQATLVPISEIAGGIANSAESYQWTVDASLGADATYGLVMKLESNPEIFQYSFPFQIAKADGPPKDDEPENGGKPTQVITTAHGIKTVTLTSCPPTTTSTVESTTESTTPIETSTFAPNTTTTTWSSSSTSTYQWNTTVVISSSTPLPPAPPASSSILVTPVPLPSTIPSDVPEAAGAHLVAGPIALIGGLAVALLAL